MATVLVVEDNPANMKLAVLLLKSAGHTVLCATDAEAGLTLARDARPGLILMDIQLPGIDGIEAISLLKRNEATRGIPIIALTALAMKGDEERIRAAGCDDYIAKPMQYKEFLAAVAGQLGRVMSASAPANPAGGAARILLVDDEDDNREVLELVLAWEGFEISQASSGREALAKVARQAPDLILLDLMMPEMTGYEVLETLKADPATRAIPVMMVSAITDPGVKARALAAGAESFLSKPIDRDDLVQRVGALLRKTCAGYREREVTPPPPR